jgi:hypothetical protein
MNGSNTFAAAGNSLEDDIVFPLLRQELLNLRGLVYTVQL